MASLKHMRKMAQLMPLGSRQGMFTDSCSIELEPVLEVDMGAEAVEAEAVVFLAAVDAGPITYSLWTSSSNG
jgi:hypothetical protein